MSFGWLGAFREGSWRDFRRFILHEKRDAPKRVRVINAELNRIGRITVFYARVTDNEGEIRTSERRTGYSVTPGSSLEKLLQAYIFQGGNLFDISMFMVPDETIVLGSASGSESEVRVVDAYPYGGILAPRTIEASTETPVDGGYLPALKYLPRRLGSRNVVWEKTVPIAISVDTIRAWASQEIQYKRHRLEAKIIKMCDLREQLLRERDELIEQAVGGTVTGIAFRERYMSQARILQNLVATVDGVFYGPDPITGSLSFDVDSGVQRLGGQYQTLMRNAETGEEDWTAL